MTPNGNPSPPEHIIVSGLPRSGTSMMMQMLQAGGMPVFTDSKRKPDANNPRGYFETEAVKHTKADPSWLEVAGRMPVKTIYRLLYDLPLDRHYRVVFMTRDMTEVMASQRMMLERSGQETDARDDARLERLFREELAAVESWLAGNRCFTTLYVDYGEILTDPIVQSRGISRFLGNVLCPVAMSMAIDPELHRCENCG